MAGSGWAFRGLVPDTSADRAHHHLSGVLRYYDETWLDYRMLWTRRRNASMHIGYWDAGTRGHSDSLLRMIDVIAGEVGLRPGHRVLDAGCGVGGTAVRLAERHGARVTGVTLPAAQVRRARRYAQVRGVSERCRFLQGDYERLTLADRSFDVVWALESACHAPDKRRFLREALRVLKPGGRLVVTDFFRTRRPHAGDGELRLAAFLAGWAMADLATTGEYAALAQRVGFEQLAVRDLSTQVVPSLRRLYRTGTCLVLPEAALYALGLRSAVQHGNTRSARSVWQTFRRGLWRYAIVLGSRPDREGQPTPSSSRRMSPESRSSAPVPL